MLLLTAIHIILNAGFQDLPVNNLMFLPEVAETPQNCVGDLPQVFLRDLARLLDD